MNTQAQNPNICPSCGGPKFPQASQCAECYDPDIQHINRKAEYAVGGPHCFGESEFETRDALLNALCAKVFGTLPTYRNK